MGLFDGLLTKPEVALPPPEVPAEYKDFLDGLQVKVDSISAGNQARVDYLEKASKIGLATAAMTVIRQEVEEKKTISDDARKALNNIKQALALGCEPATPPEDWYAGTLTKEECIDRYNGRTKEDTWPCKNYGIYTRKHDMMQFGGVIPIEALEKIADTKSLFESIRIYSPNPEHFNKVEPVPTDPIAFGRIRLMGEDHYFEVVRWDISEDLAALVKPR